MTTSLQAAATCCPFCKENRRRGQYLCINCWDQLSPAVRRALTTHDTLAVRRGAQLFDQIRQGRALAEIEVAH